MRGVTAPGALREVINLAEAAWGGGSVCREVLGSNSGVLFQPQGEKPLQKLKKAFKQLLSRG